MPLRERPRLVLRVGAVQPQGSLKPPYVFIVPGGVRSDPSLPLEGASAFAGQEAVRLGVASSICR